MMIIDLSAHEDSHDVVPLSAKHIQNLLENVPQWNEILEDIILF